MHATRLTKHAVKTQNMPLSNYDSIVNCKLHSGVLLPNNQTSATDKKLPGQFDNVISLTLLQVYLITNSLFSGPCLIVYMLYEG